MSNQCHVMSSYLLLDFSFSCTDLRLYIKITINLPGLLMVRRIDLESKACSKSQFLAFLMLSSFPINRIKYKTMTIPKISPVNITSHALVRFVDALNK